MRISLPLPTFVPEASEVVPAPEPKIPRPPATSARTTTPTTATAGRGPGHALWVARAGGGGGGGGGRTPPQDVARGGAERLGGLDEFGVDLADAELGHADAGGEREDQGGDDARRGAEAEEQHGRDQ